MRDFEIAEKLIAAFEARTKAVPIGHEIRSRGASTYAWRAAHAGELRAILADLRADAFVKGRRDPPEFLRLARGP